MQIAHIKHLIVKTIFGQATADDLRRLEAWLDESEANRELFGRLRSAAFVGGAMTDDNGALRREVGKKIGLHAAPRRGRNMRRSLMRAAAAVAIPVAVAAGMLAAGVFGGGGQTADGGAMLIRPGSPKVIVTLPGGDEMMFDRSRNVSLVSNGHTVTNEESTLSLSAGAAAADSGEYAVYRIPCGGEYAIRLGDGTTVIMNSESELRAPVRFGPGRREVWFRGEGYFDVAHDPLRQFVVRTARADIAVVGTEFNLTAYDDDPETVATLVEGSVNLRSRAGAPVTLVAGTRARVGASGVVVEPVDVYACTAWKSGRIVFDNARTDEIMKVLRRWYNCEIHYGDEAVKSRRFTMDILKYDDITGVLDLMEKVDVRYAIRGNQIWLSSR